MISMINNYVLIILILLSVYFDLTQKKIPNFLTLPVMLWGLLSYTFMNQFDGLLFSISGLLLGIGLFLIPFILGGIGGGDVKLLGAIGALKGMEIVFIATIYTALYGGVMAVVILIIKGQLLITLKRLLSPLIKPLVGVLAFRLKSPQLNLFYANLGSLKDLKTADSHYFPYGVAIGLGTLTALYVYGQSFFKIFH